MMDQEYSRLKRQISFKEEIESFETYSSEEYSRVPEEDEEDKEEEMEKVIDNLDIHGVDLNIEDLYTIDFVDFHKMLDLLDGDEEPCCDFGVFIVIKETEKLKSKLHNGDIIISVNEEDMLELTAAQVKKVIKKAESRNTKVLSLLIGRKKI